MCGFLGQHPEARRYEWSDSVVVLTDVQVTEA